MKKESLQIALAQIAPVWLNKSATIEKIESYISTAAEQGSDLVVFGEGILPGYPFWLSLTNATAFDDQKQKEIHAHYIRNSINIEKGELSSICEIAKQKKIAIYLGIIEKASNRGGHSLYASLIYIDQSGIIQSVHRKLQPTYDERLAWSPGDGHGLKVHSLGAFNVGGLNCWENWMPLSRTALYGQGENLHIAVWPGSTRNTEDITRFMAKEGRSFVLSVSGLMRKDDIPETIPYYEEIIKNAPDVLADGGSCVAGPDGNWIIPPASTKEALLQCEISFKYILQERQNFDVAGHYSRPDVTKLTVNRERQSILDFDKV